MCSPDKQSRGGNLQETESHVIVGLLLLLSLGLLSGGGVTTSGGSTTGSGGGGSVSIRVGNAVLELLNLGPADLGLNGDGEDLLVTVDQGVHDRGQGGEVDGQRDGGNGGDGAGKGLEELLLTDVEDAGGESVTLVVDLGDTQTVGEGRDVQHVEQGSLGGTDLKAGLNELEVGSNFNGTTGNLGGDTEGLEERGLAGLHTSVSGGNPDIDGGNGTSTGRGSDLVGQDLVTDVLQVTVGEDETNVALDVRQETLVLGGVVDEGTEGTANHGVLSHQDDSLSTERLTDLVHLLGGDIVDAVRALSAARLSIEARAASTRARADVRTLGEK